jgi:hypothetical protein
MSDSNRPPTDAEAMAEVLAERAREHAGPQRGDPEPEELLDYLEGRLSPEAEAAMGRRLLASPSATRDLLDLSELAAAGGGEEGAAEEPSDLADFGARAGWRDLRRRLGDETQAASGRRASRAVPALAALAAGLFVAVVGLSLQLWRGGPDDALANVRTLELEQGLRSDRVPAVAAAPGEYFRGVLFPPEPCPVYRAEIAGPGGAEVTRLDDLRRDELDQLSFLFRGAPGRYTLRLFGCEPERELSSYGFEIARSGGATSERNGS